MRIDIHAHIRVTNDQLRIEECIADMKLNKIEKRVISTFEGKSIKDGIDKIVKAVKNNKSKLIGSAIINPSLPTALDDLKYALNYSEIEMIEFDSFKHDFYPDTCEVLSELLSYLEVEKPGFPVKVFTGLGARSLPQQWEVQAKKHLNLNFILLHIACFDYGYGCVDVVKRNDNIYTETSNQYELQILKKAFEELPKEKLLFGTTYPSRLSSSGIEIFDLYDLNETTLDHIFHRNAEHLLE